MTENDYANMTDYLKNVYTNKTTPEETQLIKELFEFVSGYENAVYINQNTYCVIDCIILAYFLLTADIKENSSKELKDFKTRMRGYLAMHIYAKYGKQEDINATFDNRISVYSNKGKELDFTPFGQIVLHDIQDNANSAYLDDTPIIIVGIDEELKINLELKQFLEELNSRFVPSFGSLIKSIDKSSSHEKKNKGSKVKYCKLCGGELDENKKCTKCGKQYRSISVLKKRIPLIIVIFCLLCSLGLNIYQFISQNNQTKRITQLQKENDLLKNDKKTLLEMITERDREIDSLKSSKY